MKTLISTDTSCLINYDVLNKFPISIFPLNVIIDGQEYLDGVNIKQDFLLNQMLENKSIKTSTPPMGEVIKYFEEIFEKGYEYVIHFTISSKLSSMYSLFSQVSKNYFEEKIKIIDSYSVSTLMLSHVFYAYEEIQKGTNVDVICDEIEKRKENSYICFIPENLTALKNGGRISPAIAAIGNAVGLKPVIMLKDGMLEKDSMTRHANKSFREHMNIALEKYPISDYDYSLISFGADEKMLRIVHENMKNAIGEENIITGIIPINVCAHCGPGTIGVVTSPKINGESLKKYL